MNKRKTELIALVFAGLLFFSVNIRMAAGEHESIEERIKTSSFHLKRWRKRKS